MLHRLCSSNCDIMTTNIPLLTIESDNSNFVARYYKPHTILIGVNHFLFAVSKSC